MKKINCISAIFLLISILGYGQINTNVNSAGGTLLIEQPISYTSDNVNAFKNYELGHEAFKLGNLKKAIKHYRKAIELDQNHIDAYDNCGLSYRRLGKLDSAIYYYKKSIEINPKGTIPHGNLAIVYSIQGKYQEAINEFEEIAKYNPNDPESPYGIAGIYIQMEQYDKALPIAKKSAELYEKYQPQYVGDAYYYIGISYYYLKQKNKAKDYLHKAIQYGTQVPDEILKNIE